MGLFLRTSRQFGIRWFGLCHPHRSWTMLPINENYKFIAHMGRAFHTNLHYNISEFCSSYGSICDSNPKASRSLVFDTHNINGGSIGKIYFNLKQDLGEFEILGYAVRLFQLFL